MPKKFIFIILLCLFTLEGSSFVYSVGCPAGYTDYDYPGLAGTWCCRHRGGFADLCISPEQESGDYCCILVPSASPSGPERYRNPLVWNDIITFIWWGPIMYIYGHAIVLVVLFLLVGAYVLATSGGNPERVKRAQKIIFWTIIGYLVMLLAKGIINFIWDFIKG